jgi:hypothetical protein
MSEAQEHIPPREAFEHDHATIIEEDDEHED